MSKPTQSPHPEIFASSGPSDIDAARRLFTEYAQWLDRDHGISLDFQGIKEELAHLPGRYAPPSGQIYLARLEAEICGCIAFRKHRDDVCEIKRLYVAKSARGVSLGSRLVRQVLIGARIAGYTKAVLDTAGFMDAAHALYAQNGFQEIPRYYDNPVPGVRFMGADLIQE